MKIYRAKCAVWMLLANPKPTEEDNDFGWSLFQAGETFLLIGEEQGGDVLLTSGGKIIAPVTRMYSLNGQLLSSHRSRIKDNVHISEICS